MGEKAFSRAWAELCEVQIAEKASEECHRANRRRDGGQAAHPSLAMSIVSLVPRKADDIAFSPTRGERGRVLVNAALTVIRKVESESKRLLRFYEALEYKCCNAATAWQRVDEQYQLLSEQSVELLLLMVGHRLPRLLRRRRGGELEGLLRKFY